MISPTRHAYELLKSSLQLIKPMKRLLILPAFCSLFDLAILGLIAAPIRSLEILPQPLSQVQWEHFLIFFALYLIFLYITHLIFFFSHSTLLYAMDGLMNNQKPSLKLALQKALKSYGPVFLWVTFASTLGMIWSLFRSKEKRAQSWGIAAYFILPILLEEKLSPLKAFQRSSDLISQTWGQPLRPQFQSFSILILGVLICLVPALIGLSLGGKLFMSLGGLITAFLIFFFGIFYISAKTLLLWTLYQFAKKRQLPQNISEELVKNAFVVREDPN